MITQLRIQNFKCLRDTGTLAIRPLTFLVGPNSSGKSSLLQVLLMLKQTVESRDIENPLTTNGPYVELGTYQDFVTDHDMSQNLTVQMRIAADKVIFTDPRGLWKPKEGDQLALETAFEYDRRRKRIALKHTRIELLPLTFRIERQRTGRHKLVYAQLLDSGDPLQVDETAKPIKFFDAVVGATPTEREDLGASLFNLLMLAFRQSVNTLFGNLYYIGPLREPPQRFYIATGETRQDVGLRGESAVEVLCSESPKQKNGAGLLAKVNQWVRQLEIGEQATLQRLGKSGTYRLVIQHPVSHVEANVADVGFGVSQVLPVIVEGFYAPEGATLLLEHPEIHLHPKAQAHLGDLFIDIVKSERKTLIVETHSEHLLSRVRRRIAEGTISREDVAIYYFDPREDGTHVQEVTLNELGQYENFPEGFFDEGYEEALEHMRVMAKRAKKEANSGAGRKAVGD